VQSKPAKAPLRSFELNKQRRKQEQQKEKRKENDQQGSREKVMKIVLD